MKFIINSSSFAKYLQSISGVLTNNTTVPILDHFYFQLDESVLTVKATDLETTMIVKIELDNANAETVSSVAIPAKILLDILKTFNDIPLTFAVNDNYAVEISSGEGKYRLAGQNPETYPATPEMAEMMSISLDSQTVVNAISKTLFATSNDELRPQMTGVFCELTPENVTFVATDAHKLVRYRFLDRKADESGSFILPKKPLNLLKNILTSNKEEVDVLLEYNTVNASFAFKNYSVICRLIDGRYPNYDAAIPKENPNKLIVDRNLFLNAIRRVSIFANQSTHQVRFALNGSELLITAEDIEFSNEAKERIACNYEGDSLEIGFNSKFLMEMLSNVDTEQVLMEMSQPNRAGLILPQELEENTKENVLMLVMPVMLANN